MDYEFLNIRKIIRTCTLIVDENLILLVYATCVKFLL
jgi:hypothetical protein